MPDQQTANSITNNTLWLTYATLKNGLMNPGLLLFLHLAMKINLFVLFFLVGKQLFCMHEYIVVQIQDICIGKCETMSQIGVYLLAEYCFQHNLHQCIMFTTMSVKWYGDYLYIFIFTLATHVHDETDMLHSLLI